MFNEKVTIRMFNKLLRHLNVSYDKTYEDFTHEGQANSWLGRDLQCKIARKNDIDRLQGQIDELQQSLAELRRTTKKRR